MSDTKDPMTGITRHPVLTVDGDTFLRDGRPHQVISGSIHYFRVHPDLWEDRLDRLKALGLNTIDVYVAWNVHERQGGVHDFTGANDLERFLTLAGRAGFDVILRPGPYICAEWDFGGFPAWLMSEPGIRLRCLDDRYLAALDGWLDVLIARVLPFLATRGGPVVAVQVENEYGSYGDDADYLEHCRKGLVDRGVDVLLLTSDGPGPDWLDNGTIPGVVATANFGSRVGPAFEALRAARPTGPLMCMEFWNGWFDHWSEGHHLRDVADVAAVLDEILASGASVNLYMAHGGTNFGLWSGANEDGGRLQPTVTSYDYDAAVGEAGELTAKFHAFREVISRYAVLPDAPLPAAPPRLDPQTTTVGGWVGLFDSLDAFDTPVPSAMPLSMEELGQDHGLVLYRGDVLVPPDGRELVLDGLADRALVHVDGVHVATVSSTDAEHAVPVTPREDRARTRLDLLVENQGRINYGPRMGERKGLSAVRLRSRYIHGWESTAIRLDDPKLTAKLAFGDEQPSAGAVFARLDVEVDEPADGFIALPGWEKGFVWLNGYLLGRYWAIGPQVTLYAPAPLWRQGSNEIVVLELHTPGTEIEIRDTPDLGRPTPV